MAAGLSRSLGRPGGVIGGRVALAVDPGLLRRMSVGRCVALVSGTNGKTTTTRMLATALSGATSPAWNSSGANLRDGALAALLDRPDASTAVLEVDECYLPGVIADTRPALVLLLNLTRDQLDRVGETRMVAARIRRALAGSPQTVVVANAADPLVVAAAADAPRKVWIGPPSAWQHDAAVCPLCLNEIVYDRCGWHCTGCELRRPVADWRIDRSGLAGPGGLSVPIELTLPGEANRTNAAFAVAGAAEFGIPADRAARTLSAIRDVAGRYRWIDRGGSAVRLLLAKNPAGWREVLSLLSGSDTAVVISVNSRQADGRDPSWLWDVSFDRLRGRTVIAAGDRARDLSVRLHYAEVPHTVAADVVSAVDSLRVPAIEVAADYTSFVGARARLHPTR